MLWMKNWNNFMMVMKEQWLIVTPNIRSLQEISMQKLELRRRRLQKHRSIWNKGEGDGGGGGRRGEEITYPSSVRILSCWDCSELLLPYHNLHASGWLWSLEALVVDLGMSLFLVDIPHQSCRPSFPGQRLVCWHLHTSMSIFWCTSWAACLLFSFYATGRCVLICVFHLSSLFRSGWAWGYWLTSWALRIIPLCWRDLDFVLVSMRGFLCTEGNNWSLWESPMGKQETNRFYIEKP